MIIDEAAADRTVTARNALEKVCAGRDWDGVARCYHPEFTDHANGRLYHGHEGVRESVALYLELFPDVLFEVDDHVAEGDRVALRWTLHGTHRGREVELHGIVLSRFEGGRIIEDHYFTDTMELVRQLGVWRTLLLAIQKRRLLFGKS